MTAAAQQLPTLVPAPPGKTRYARRISDLVRKAGHQERRAEAAERKLEVAQCQLEMQAGEISGLEEMLARSLEVIEKYKAQLRKKVNAGR
jgi:hypothetical protein